MIRSKGREREKSEGKSEGKVGRVKRGNWDKERGTREKEIQTVGSVCVCIHLPVQ